MDQVLGFVGVGRMGGPMANRLLDAGHSLCVFDTSAEAVKPLAARGAKVRLVRRRSGFVGGHRVDQPADAADRAGREPWAAS